MSKRILNYRGTQFYVEETGDDKTPDGSRSRYRVYAFTNPITKKFSVRKRAVAEAMMIVDSIIENATNGSNLYINECEVCGEKGIVELGQVEIESPGRLETNVFFFHEKCRDRVSDMLAGRLARDNSGASVEVFEIKKDGPASQAKDIIRGDK